MQRATSNSQHATRNASRAERPSGTVHARLHGQRCVGTGWCPSHSLHRSASHCRLHVAQCVATAWFASSSCCMPPSRAPHAACCMLPPRRGCGALVSAAVVRVRTGRRRQPCPTGRCPRAATTPPTRPSLQRSAIIAMQHDAMRCSAGCNPVHSSATVTARQGERGAEAHIGRCRRAGYPTREYRGSTRRVPARPAPQSAAYKP